MRFMRNSERTLNFSSLPHVVYNQYNVVISTRKIHNMDEDTSFGKFWKEFIEETISDSEDSEYVCDLERSTDSQTSSEELDEQFSESGNENPLYTCSRDKKTFWFKTKQYKGRRRKCNIVTCLPRVKSTGKNAKSILDVWQLYFPDNVLNKIVTYTNIYIEKGKESYQRERDTKCTTLTEIKALIGLLYLAGVVMRSSYQNLQDLYDNDGTGCDIFRATMSYKRMRFLLKCIRFDNIHNRQERRLIDKLAAVREIFEDFVANCKTHYNISEYATIDEMMLDCFRGKCSFPQYIKSKPEKYGIKIFVLMDAQTLYTANLEMYAGIQPDGPYKVSNSAFDVVKRLVRPISGTGRNITMDDWFSSIPLAKALLKDDNLTIVATIQKNKKEIPSSFATSERRELYSSKFRFSKNMTLVSYVPKKNKTVLLLSTMHYDDALNDDDPKKKPQIIEFYNLTKGGVNVFDEMKSTYSVSRKSNRWSLIIFFSTLDIGAINAQIVYQTNNKCKMIRRAFLKQLGMELIQQHLENRLEMFTLSRSLRQRISKILKKSTILTRTNAQGRCKFCSSTKNRKTKKQCQICNSYICNEHAFMLCPNCTDFPETGLSEDNE